MSEPTKRTAGSIQQGAFDEQPFLSVCIATRNRSNYIGLTLDNILEQCGNDVEVVVVDGASTDDTPAVVGKRAAESSNLKYFPQTANSGIDGDFDKAIELARGKYCWLMSDDDVLAPGAIARVLGACREAPDVVIIDAEVRTADLTEVLKTSRLGFTGERHYAGTDIDRLFVDCGDHLTFIGGVVVFRELWIGRERRRYFGSEFIHVGVLFQAVIPGSIIVIGEPLVRIRYGVGNWVRRAFHVWMFKWPSLVWSLSGISETAKRGVCAREPWRSPRILAYYRATGAYSPLEFREFLSPRTHGLERIVAFIIGVIPGSVVNFVAVLHSAMIKRVQRGALYDLLHSSHTTAASRLVARMFSV